MPDIRQKSSAGTKTVRAADNPAATQTNPASAGASPAPAARGEPGKASARSPKNAAAQGGEKAAAPTASKSANGPVKPKWINTLPSTAPASGRGKTSSAAPGADPLDQWVNAPLAPPKEPANRAPAEAPETEPPRPAPARKSAAAARSAPAKRRELKAAPPAASPESAAPAPRPAATALPETSPTPEAVKLEPAPTNVLEPPRVPPPSEPAESAAAEARPTTQPAAGETFGFGVNYPMPNVEALATNIASAIEHAAKAMAAYLRPRETGEIKTTFAEEVGEMVESIGHVAEYYMSDPKRAFDAQTELTTQFINLWASTLQRFQGLPAKPVVEPDRSDKRFSDAEWRKNPFFDFLKQAYVLTTQWADDLVRHADELEPHRRDKARFYLRQVTAALSPSNFIGTNPELLRATLEESGENLARGLKMLAEDIEAGKGNLRIRQSDARAFKLGVNLATTPGKVIFRNDLIELIQYEPTTPEVYKRPLLIVTPWINKFYILDLNPEKSFIRWAVAQGLTVFVTSWVNPDSRHADKGFDAYRHEGVLAALDCVEQATGERDVTAIGYCVGGTLLATTLGYMAEIGDERIKSVTFFTALVDFTDAGDLKVFVDAEQLKAVEERMAELGYLEGSAMAGAFNMLRPNDLIWSYYVNNYLKGKEPMPFDLLVWNSDSTRMPAANHRFYLRHCYLQNDLSNGRMVLSGKTIDLRKVTIPIYELATKEDHIAPARGVFTGAKVFAGPVKFVLAGSGHIAGVVNPADKPKYQFWTDGPVEGDLESWLAKAKETPGSWWPDWIQWIAAQAPEKVPARKPGEGKLKPICDAPGEYVRVKA